MSDLGLVLRQTKYGLKSLGRNPRAVVFSLIFPVVLLVLFNSIFASDGSSTRLPGGLDLDIDSYFTAGIMAYAIVMSCFSTLAISLTSQRESGQLKRFRGTPMPPWTFMASQILRSILMVLLMVLVLLVIGRIAFDVKVPADTLPGLVVYVLLGTATMCSLGIALTTVARTADSASTVAPFGAVLISFISGVFIPVEELPSWLAEVGRVFPLAHLAEGLQTTFSSNASGIGLSAENVAVLGAWGLVALVVAAREFRWEPQAVRA
jgi:ABC-2 type transport system permease protein